MSVHLSQMQTLLWQGKTVWSLSKYALLGQAESDACSPTGGLSLLQLDFSFSFLKLSFQLSCAYWLDGLGHLFIFFELLFLFYYLFTLILFFKLYFIDYGITVVPIFLPLPPSIQHYPLLLAILTPLFMSMGHVYRFFGYSIFYTVLYIPMLFCNYLFVLLSPLAFSSISPHPSLATIKVFSISMILSLSFLFA